jgi:hypothetical protein
MKKSLAIIIYISISNDKEILISNSNMPNQYARVKNVAKGEHIFKENTDQTYAFVDEFLEEAIKSSNIYGADEDVDYEYWSSNHNAHAILSISNSLLSKCMKLLLLHLPKKYHIGILDDSADTYVLGQGWEVLSVHNSRRENKVGFNHEAAVKRNLPIVSAITAVDLPDEISVILIVHEAIYNDSANQSLLSEFSIKGLWCKR